MIVKETSGPMQPFRRSDGVDHSTWDGSRQHEPPTQVRHQPWGGHYCDSGRPAEAMMLR